ncbi:hypothetical protein AMS68_003667 [Peltaster fructicola]|uniref:DUF4345 domain-containing protein n=1 Tax=Peltaster fructicola TaxID=286661 RepID=A0A6H0XUM2_9PEZI|nr:hypothetical protein AMS68_003667 [Peltaster fructicola]
MALSSEVLSRILKGSALFALATGSMDMVLGSGALSLPASTPIKGPMAVMDSQLSFLGAVWAGYGAALWWASNDMKARRELLGILGMVMFVGGLARINSYFKHGFGASWILPAMVVELVGPPAMYLLGC